MKDEKDEKDEKDKSSELSKPSCENQTLSAF
ncbi:Uncharacterised protein [Vibrio alginolyticus]|nr:Uncharacterised protein [Vibrio alginolyticus]